MKRKFFCKRNIIICCIVFCIVLCIIYISDDRQQKSYDKVYMAYVEMGNGEYQEAADIEFRVIDTRQSNNHDDEPAEGCQDTGGRGCANHAFGRERRSDSDARAD